MSRPDIQSATTTRPHPAAAGTAAPDGAGGVWWSRREDVRLTTGSGTFVGDVNRDGQLWLKVVRSPVAHGTIVSMTTETAVSAPGVRAVLTADDLESVPHIPLRLRNRPEMAAYCQPVLAHQRVRYVGEPVAVVVASTLQEAEDAAELVGVDIDPLPAALALEDEHESLVWDSTPDDVLCTFEAHSGDVDTVLGSADHVVTRELSLERDTGLPLETRGLVAEWEAGSERLHLWGPTKFVTFTRATVADWFGLTPDCVTCHHVDVGGMFGPRGELYPEDYLVPWAARVVAAPVKWLEDRSEHLTATNHSRGQIHRISVAVSGTGDLIGFTSESVVDLGAYARPLGGRMPEITVESLPGPYRWQAFDITCTGRATNKTPTGTMRGPGAYEAAFIRERMLDIVAHELGRDPIDLRRQNLVQPEEIPYVRDMGPKLHPPTYDSGDFPLVADELTRTLDYPRTVAEVAQRREAGELVGLGTAFFLAHSGMGRDESIELTLLPEGRFRFRTTASEIGQGLATMIARLAAAELGVSEQLIDVVTNQTEGFDGGRGTYSARGAIFVGNAVQDAAAKMRAALFEADPTADPVDPDTWSRPAPYTVVGQHRSEEPTYGFGASSCLARLDRDTLQVTVERLVVAYDCGRVIDPASAHGQIVGAAAQGVGGALLQELTFDDSGQPQNATFMDFLLPTVAETPPIEAVLLELPGTPNPLGVKGVAEAGIMGVGAAVANAVSAAVGHPDAVVRLPIRPDDLLPRVPGPEAHRPSGRTGRAASRGQAKR